MDAAFYDLIHENISDDKSSHVSLKADRECGIERIVWSIWDYVVGPESKFIWDVKEESHSDHQSDKRDSSIDSPSSSSIRSQAVENSTTSAEDETRLTTTSENSSVYSKVPMTPSLSSGTDKMTSSSANTDTNDAPVDDDVDSDDDDVIDGSSMSEMNTRYAAVYSLSSEIFKSCIGNSSEFKLISAPGRNMSLAAYVYTAKYRGQNSRFSICLLFDDKNLAQFLALKTFTDQFFNDFIIRLKAASLTESDEELLTRMSNSLTEFLGILCRLNSPDAYSSSAFKISETLLSKANLGQDSFLRQSISTHLQCQGRTVVFGNDIRKVNKLVKTLAMFLPAKYKKLCLLMSPLDQKNVYCPYLMVQGLPKRQNLFFAQQCVYSTWPVCVVDSDQNTVHHSMPLRTHLGTRLKAIKRDLTLILSDVEVQNDQPILGEFSTSFSKDSLVANFLAQMDFLPYDELVRYGFVCHFNSLLLQYANALNVYAKFASDSGKSKKRTKLSDVKAALKLETTGDLSIILATADRHQPGLAAFLS